MDTFKDRLKIEMAELDTKITKLIAFQKSENFSKVTPTQATLLNIQVLAMTTYSQCLSERITDLENE